MPNLLMVSCSALDGKTAELARKLQEKEEVLDRYEVRASDRAPVYLIAAQGIS